VTLTFDLESYFSILDGSISTRHTHCLSEMSTRYAANAVWANPYLSDREGGVGMILYSCNKCPES